MPCLAHFTSLLLITHMTLDAQYEFRRLFLFYLLYLQVSFAL